MVLQALKKAVHMLQNIVMSLAMYTLDLYLVPNAVGPTSKS